MALCARRGCQLPVFVEPRTQIAHKYCGRTHALENEGQIQQPHGMCYECNLNGCSKAVAFDPTNGRVHDFCCRDHANQAIRAGKWSKPQSLTSHSSKVHKCNLPSCGFPVYNDGSGRKFDYCGRSHAVEHRLMQDQVGHVFSGHATTGLAMAAPTSAPTPVCRNFATGICTFGTKCRFSHEIERVSSKSTASSAIESSPAVKTEPVPLPTCVVCLSLNADIILIPCGHVCLCHEDADKLAANRQLVNCPLCNHAVASTNKVFLNN